MQRSEAGNRTFETQMCRCIRLLKAMLSEFEAKASANGSGIYIQKHGQRLRGDQITLRLVRFSSEGGEMAKELPRVTVFSNSTLGSLRKQIAQLTKEEVSRLRLIAKGAG